MNAYRNDRYDDIFLAGIIAKYTEDRKVACLDFHFTTTPPCPSHHHDGCDEAKSPPVGYVEAENALIVYVTADGRRRGTLVDTYDAESAWRWTTNS